MQPSASLVFFGNERLSTGFSPEGAPILESLLDAGYHIAAVVSHYEPGNSRSARRLEIETVAKNHNIPLLLPQKPADIADQLRSYGAAIGILAAYGKIVPQSIIDIFPKGILNVHPSLLPKYRGPTPIESAILDGAPETGVSIMGLVKAMDAGPIYAQATLPLTSHETKQALTQQLLTMGGKLLLEILPKAIDETINPTAQDEAAATYTLLIQKSDGRLNPQKPALQLEREVRAYAGWPKSTIELFGHSIIVTKANVTLSNDSGPLVIPCNPGFLEIVELIAPSGRRMAAGDFIRGYANK